MAKARKPAAKRSKSTKSAAPKAAAAADTTAKTASASASNAKSTASKAVDAGADAAKASAEKAVTPSAMKKDMAATSKPMPKVARVPKSEMVETKAAKPETAKAESTKTDAPKPDAAKSATPSPASTPPAQEAKRRSVFLPLVLGGLIAGAIGYGVSEYDLLGTRGQNADTGLQETVDAQETRLAALEAVEPVEIPEVDLSALDDLSAQVTQVSEQMSGLTTQIGELDTKLVGLDERLTIVEKQPLAGEVSEAAIAAYERELGALQTSVEKQRAEIESMLDEVLVAEKATADAATAASIQSALTKVSAAISTGEPFGDAVGELEALGVSDLPAALTDPAPDGVASLTNLQADFPDAARASLAAARSGDEAESEGGIGSFLSRQLGARSVAPREGPGPDAVLSRAEAAMREGQLDTALTEIDALPEGAQAAMQEWLDSARARQAAQAAAQDLSSSLKSN